ncbi:MAG: glycoside hydrolase family 24 [Alphaproteobacteria bacterium PA3]|nr:MAG: glycoside hydrolase family 24 [Alphaproteobacteria bacterium PA3]
MSAFHNIGFPLKLARGAVGGPERVTEIVALANGREVRNTCLSRSRRRWEVGSAIRNLDDLAEVTAFFEARLGRLHVFRFSDPADHKSCRPSQSPQPFDQLLGTGNGSQKTFQLQKTYGDAAGSTVRPIHLPVLGSVRVGVGTAELSASAFSVDSQTGLLTLSTAPAAGQPVRAGFYFDTPVRFDSDRLDIAHDAFEAGRVISLALVEILL